MTKKENINRGFLIFVGIIIGIILCYLFCPKEVGGICPLTGGIFGTQGSFGGNNCPDCPCQTTTTTNYQIGTTTTTYPITTTTTLTQGTTSTTRPPGEGCLNYCYSIWDGYTGANYVPDQSTCRQIQFSTCGISGAFMFYPANGCCCYYC